MKERKIEGGHQNLKVKQRRHKRAKHGSRTFGSLRQLRYRRAFRIESPAWPLEFLKVAERETIKMTLATEGEQEVKAELVNEAEAKELLLLISDLATGLWRIERKTNGMDELKGPMRSVRRHIESTLDTLTSASVEIHDYTGEKYVTGMALKVIAFQPTPSVSIEKIAETIKPSVFYRDKLIQRGEVIVETPETELPDRRAAEETAVENGSSGEREQQDEKTSRKPDQVRD